MVRPQDQGGYHKATSVVRQLRSLAYGNGLIYSKAYDPDNWLTRWTVEHGAISG